MVRAMCTAATVLASLMILTPCVRAQDAFTSVRCGADIPKALAGKVIPDDRVAAIERRHRDIGLKNHGAMGISNTLTFISWTICGSEYALLLDQRDTIRAVLRFPPHSRRRRVFIGSCEVDGQESSEAILAILDNPSPLPAGKHYGPNDETLLSAISARQIDEKRAQFMALSVSQLRCPCNGIITRDGGP